MYKLILAPLMIIGGIALGLYVGVWVMLIGGIIGLIQGIAILVASGTVEVGLISFSVLKILLSSLVGYICMVILVLPAMVMLQD